MALGKTVVVPVVNPTSAGDLARLAAALAKPDGGRVVPVTVVGVAADPMRVDAAESALREGERAAREAGVAAEGVLLATRSVVEAVGDTLDEQRATLVVMGWQGRDAPGNVFGELIDEIARRRTVPLAVVRSHPGDVGRILFTLSEANLAPIGSPGMMLGGELVRRLQSSWGSQVVVLRTDEAKEPLPASLAELGDRVHHDRREVDLAVAAAARAGDFIVTPVAPTAAAVRSATSKVAWAAPDSSVLIAVHPDPHAEEVAEAARRAAGAPDNAALVSDSGVFDVFVTARRAVDEGADPAGLADALRLVGPVDHVDGWPDGPEAVLQATVRVEAPTATIAIAAVMTAVHDAEALQGADISYDVVGTG